MKSLSIKIFLIFFFFLAFGAYAKNLILKENQSYQISRYELEYKNNEYFLFFDKVIMNNGSAFIIPSFLAGKALSITIKYFVAKKRTLIIQPFSSQYENPFISLSHQYLKNHPQGKKGLDGVSFDSQADTTNPGASGRPGKSGETGKNGTFLKLNLGINRIDNLLILLKSESGGDGGSGGTGQQGGGASCRKGSAGDGGTGGKGGAPGYPGNIAGVKIIWHEISPIFSDENDFPLGLSIRQQPGISGIPGKGGEGGKGGDGKSCFITTGRSNGVSGARGENGDFLKKGRPFFTGSVGKVFVKKELSL